MEMIPLQRDGGKKPKYQVFADWVRQQIGAGELKADQQLLSYSEIEAQLGFSQNTVDRAYKILQDEGLIYRVHGSGVFVKAATPDAQASEEGSGFIGYVDKEFAHSKNFLYYTNLMQGAQRVADAQGKQLVVISSLENFRKWDHLEGVVLCSTGHDPNFNGQALREAIPERLAVVNSLLPDPVIPSVVADDADGIRQSVEHLIELGHRRIASLSQINYPPARFHPLVRLRHEAYLSALHANGISPRPDWFYTPQTQQDPDHFDYYRYGHDGIREWLAGGWRELGCTALLAHNDLVAMGAIDALRENGVSVPDDVSVISFDGVEIFRTAPYDLTTVRVPLHEIGAQTLNVLLQHTRNPLRTAKTTKLPVQLIEGRTTAPARGAAANRRKSASASASLVTA